MENANYVANENLIENKDIQQQLYMQKTKQEMKECQNGLTLEIGIR